MQKTPRTNADLQTPNRVATCGVVGHYKLKEFFMKALITRIVKGMMTVIVMGSAALVAAADAYSAPTDDAQRNSNEPLMLRGIMQNLSTDMQQITGAMAMEDWQQVAQAATRVADHPQPTMSERLRIMAFLGTDAAIFKGYDQRVHTAAMKLAEAARREEGGAAIKAFAEVQSNCLGCHQTFRQPFQAHFEVNYEQAY
tara:strand:- start:1455 stop:2048 length:594 start_codon:yes stop_codon:yes gene_type:complete